MDQITAWRYLTMKQHDVRFMVGVVVPSHLLCRSYAEPSPLFMQRSCRKMQSWQLPRTTPSTVEAFLVEVQMLSRSSTILKFCAGSCRW